MDRPKHVWYAKDGKNISYKKLIQDLKDADVILFGELHDNEIAHQQELEILKSLFESRKNNLIIGAEMFESDDQLKLNELTSGLISFSSFEKEAKLWSNYKDYKPLLQFSVEKKLDFIGTNVPRRYAALVARQGLEILDSLSPDAKKLMAPLPIDLDLSLPGYAALNTGAMHGHEAMKFLAEAQALKDATMAHFILHNLIPGNTFLHLNGAYHSDNYEGIYWMLKKKNPELKIITISTVVLKELKKPDSELLKKADYVLVVQEEQVD